MTNPMNNDIAMLLYVAIKALIIVIAIGFGAVMFFAVVNGTR